MASGSSHPMPDAPLDGTRAISPGIAPTSDPDGHVFTTKEKDWLPALDIQRLPPYLAISNMLGFRERFSLIFFIVFGGALVGFVLARSRSLDPNNFPSQLRLGEPFWATREPWKGFLAAHVVLSFCGSILVVWEFVPAILRHYVTFHRINGYVSLILLFPATLCGAVVGRHAVGGDIGNQSGLYVLSILTSYYGFEGIRTVREVRRHRRWMLRFASLLGVVITMRLIIFCADEIITYIGSYYSLWKCDQLLYVIGNFNDYPSCLAAQKVGGNLAQVQVAIHASTREAPINNASARRATSPMAIWLALIIHMIGSEIYIRATESANRDRDGFVLGRPGMIQEELLSSDR